jgi:hypothetical protein
MPVFPVAEAKTKKPLTISRHEDAGIRERLCPVPSVVGLADRAALPGKIRVCFKQGLCQLRRSAIIEA